MSDKLMTVAEAKKFIGEDAPSHRQSHHLGCTCDLCCAKRTILALAAELTEELRGQHHVQFCQCDAHKLLRQIGAIQ